MKYFITGGSGLLGERLSAVSKDNDELTLVHNSNPADNTVKCDITNEKEVNSCIEQENPDVIIHCAAMTHVDNCEDEVEKAYKINGDGTGFLAKAAERNDAKIIYVTTDFVFDGTREKLIHKEFMQNQNMREKFNYKNIVLIGQLPG